MKKKPRFYPVKRTALDMKTYWVVWDAYEECYSAFGCHGVYKLKRNAQFAIDFYEKQGYYVNQL